MRWLTATGGTVLLNLLLQGCQSTDDTTAYTGTRHAPQPGIASPMETDQTPDLKQQARAYAARLERGGCAKGEERALFEATSESIERNLAALKGADNPPANMTPPHSLAETAATLAEARLDVGDAARVGGCLEIANVQYRAVLRSFPEPRYAGYRQRAEFGLSASQL